MKHTIKWRPFTASDDSSHINTPMGVFEVNDPLNPVNVFNMFVMETNFTIAEKHILILDDVNGVEGSAVVSQYQLLICIGKSFNEDKVKNVIEMKILGGISNHLTESDLNREVKKPALIFPNGFTLNPTVTDGYDSELYKEAAKYCGGVYAE